jgi:hypothetical protein
MTFPYMKQYVRWTFCVLLIAMSAAVSACSGSEDKSSLSPQLESTSTPDASAIAADAFVWGLPMVVTMRTMQTLGPVIGVNHLYAQQQLSDASSRSVVAPNVDTLYDVTVLDLRNGPVVLSVPEIHDRYYTFQFVAMNTESFAYVGTRATGGEAGSWLIAPPGWNEAVPSGDQLIEAPTPLVFLLGRVLVLSADDLPTAQAVMAQMRLEPLTPQSGEAASPASLLGAAPGKPQTVADAGAAFFDELGDVLAVSPPASEEDLAELARFAAIGVGPGLHPAADGTADERAALAKGVADGAERVKQELTSSTDTVNGWRSHPRLGQYGDDFLLRAAIAQAGWGANVPEEAVYVTSTQDANGDDFEGSRGYVMHFPAGQLPPAEAFWSLTLYAPDMFLFDNPARRYAIGDRTPGLQTNPDGSLDVYLQQSAPPGRESNWLPTPEGGFVLEMRIYLPEPAVLDGTYHLPGVTPG